MDKKIIISALIGAVVSFLLGWLVYGIILRDYYHTNMHEYPGLMKDPPNLFAIFFGGLAWTLLLAYIYRRWAGVTTFSQGAVNGLIIGFLVQLSMDLYFYASMDLYGRRLLAVDVIVAALFSAIVGGFIGWMLGMLNKNETAA